MILSHPAEGNIKEKSLYEHLKNVAESSMTTISKLKLNLSLIEKNDLVDLVYFLGISHDFGKSTSYFQAHILNEYNGKDANHALISAIFCYYLVLEKFNSNLIAIISYMVIKRHHGNLETINELGSSEAHILKKQLDNIKKNGLNEVSNIYQKLLQEYQVDFNGLLEKIDIDDFIDLSEDFEEELAEIDDENKIELFLLTNLLFSILIDYDKKDAARLTLEYFDGSDKSETVNLQEYIEYKRRDDPDRFSLDIPINKLRSDFLNEILNNKNIGKGNKFYTLSAPTGIGKTFGAFGFANKLKEQLGNTKIIYCLPFTSIIDQNFNELEKILKFKYGEKYNDKPNKYLLRHHYLTPKIIRNRKEVSETRTFKDYMDDKLLVESWESSHIVTTFIQIFYSIIGYKNSFLKKFHNIVNSIIILDEVQVLNPEYYLLIKEIFNVLGKKFNTYFLLLTATQPKIFEKDDIISLVSKDKYSKDDIFNRVNLSIDLNPKSLSEFYNLLANTIKKDKYENCLIVMNTKKSVINLYNKIYSNFNKEYSIYCLTTFLTPNDRLTKILEIKESLKNNEKVIVISTQLIEAGVDLSFKYVYRDFGLLDSIVQVAGRCNRNGELLPEKGKMFLVRLKSDDSDKFFYQYVYKESIFEQWIKETFDGKTKFESKDFVELCKTYFNKFDFKSLSMQFVNSAKNLNYTENKKPIKDFILIDELFNQETIVICQTKEIEKFIENLNTNYSKLEDNKISKQERQKCLLNIMGLKNKIIPYQVSISERDLKKYLDADVVKSKKDDNSIYVSYVAYNYQKKYLYDKNIGFCIEPKGILPAIINF